MENGRGRRFTEVKSKKRKRLRQETEKAEMEYKMEHSNLSYGEEGVRND